MNKTIIAIAAAMAVGGVTAQAKAPRGTSDALFPYMPKARAEMQQDGFGKPDAFQAKASKGAVKVGAFKTLNPHVLSRAASQDISTHLTVRPGFSPSITRQARPTVSRDLRSPYSTTSSRKSDR